MVIEESVLDGFMDRQEDTIDNFFDSILYPSDNDIIERIEKNRTIAGFNVFAEPKNKKIKLAERQPEDTLESYIEAKYLKGVVEPMAALVISDAVNRGRDNAIKSVDGINITHAEWSANLEGNPCPFCAERNGQIVSINNPDYVDCQPPVHPNCECIWVYITDKERTGDGNLIEEDWTPPADEDRLKFRMFDIYNAKDLDNLAEVFASKAVRISEEQEEILYSRIQKIRDKILMEGSIDIENILGWQKLIPEDSEKVKNEKSYNNTEVFCKNFVAEKISLLTGEEITAKLILAKTKKEAEKYKLTEGKEKIISGIYSITNDEIRFNLNVVKGVGRSMSFIDINTVFHEYFHASVKNNRVFPSDRYEDTRCELLSLKSTLKFIKFNEAVKGDIIEEIISYSGYNRECSDAVLQIIGSKKNNDPEKIYRNLLKMKKDSKEANNFINKVRIKELNSQDDFTQKEYNNLLKKSLKNDIIKEESRSVIEGYLQKNSVEEIRRREKEYKEKENRIKIIFNTKQEREAQSKLYREKYNVNENGKALVTRDEKLEMEVSKCYLL